MAASRHCLPIHVRTPQKCRVPAHQWNCLAALWGDMLQARFSVASLQNNLSIFCKRACKTQGTLLMSSAGNHMPHTTRLKHRTSKKRGATGWKDGQFAVLYGQRFFSLPDLSVWVLIDPNKEQNGWIIIIMHK